MHTHDQEARTSMLVAGHDAATAMDASRFETRIGGSSATDNPTCTWDLNLPVDMNEVEEDWFDEAALLAAQQLLEMSTSTCGGLRDERMGRQSDSTSDRSIRVLEQHDRPSGEGERSGAAPMESTGISSHAEAWDGEVSVGQEEEVARAAETTACESNASASSSTTAGDRGRGVEIGTYGKKRIKPKKAQRELKSGRVRLHSNASADSEDNYDISDAAPCRKRQFKSLRALLQTN